MRARVVSAFERRFGIPPTHVARAPGRVNLIGDHTDYNDGFVLPMAIDRAVWIAFRHRDDRHVLVHSLDFDEDEAIDLRADLVHVDGWQEYVHGVAWTMGTPDARPLGGWEGVAAGDVPLGAGLSSSAALELAMMRAFASASQRGWEPKEMALLAQRAENQWVGVNCGIMDQLISAAGVVGRALLIDCRSLDTRAVSIPDDASVVVLDTATRRGLVDSEYNERRARCEAAARFFGVRALRDVDQAMFNARAGELDEVTRRRARHVISENARTLAAADALEAGDVRRVGVLMNESHASLRDDFEVSRSELDIMVSVAHEQDGCFGARMTGAGFGGCCVALVNRNSTAAFARETASRYTEATGRTPSIHVCAASAGASVEAL